MWLVGTYCIKVIIVLLSQVCDSINLNSENLSKNFKLDFFTIENSIYTVLFFYFLLCLFVSYWHLLYFQRTTQSSGKSPEPEPVNKGAAGYQTILVKKRLVLIVILQLITNQ
jgi:hypothetical protein